MTEQPTCASCKFHHARPAPWADDDDVDAVEMFCRRRAPVISMSTGWNTSVWPSVDPSCWCGEHEPRLR